MDKNNHNSESPPKTSLRNNILIAFLLIVIAWGISLTTIFQHLVKSVLVEEGVASDIVNHVSRHFIAFSTGYTLACLFVVVLVAYFLSTRLLRPIKKLSEAVKAMKAGDADVQVEVMGDDELGRLSIAFNDMVTERRRAETTLMEAYRRAEKANRAKSEFLSVMSHELRTPLNAIIGFSQVLQAKSFGPLNEKQDEYVGDISQSGHHLLSLINDILDLSKIEAGKVEMNIEEFSLNALLKETTKMFAEMSLIHRVQLSVDLNADIDTIKADKRMIKQIIFNLLSNAIKFTPPGGQVGVEAGRNDKKESTITVWDTGIGILENDRNKIFNEFVQIEHGTARTYGGTGLGLSLSKKMVEMHGGKIWVESEGQNKGSRFSFSLPQRSFS